MRPGGCPLACHCGVGLGAVCLVEVFSGSPPGSPMFHRHTTRAQAGMLRATVPHDFIDRAAR